MGSPLVLDEVWPEGEELSRHVLTVATANRSGPCVVFVERTVETQARACDRERRALRTSPRSGVHAMILGESTATMSVPISAVHRLTGALGAGRPRGAFPDPRLAEFQTDSLRLTRDLLEQNGWPHGGAPQLSRRREVIRHDVVISQRAVARSGRPPVSSIRISTRLRWDVQTECGAKGSARQGTTSSHLPNTKVPIDSDAVQAVAARQCDRMTDADSPQGHRRTPAVFGPRAGAALIHELLGHALEGDHYTNPDTYLSMSVGRQLCAADLNVSDDPTLHGWWGSVEIDDEGRPATPTPLVESGLVAGALTTDAFHVDGHESSGSARRQDYTYAALPRATNTVVHPGSESPSAMLSPSRTGLLHVLELGGGETSPVTGTFTFAAREANFISPNGDVRPLRDVVIAGRALDVLDRFTAAANDTQSDNITCGKNNQWIAVGLASPAMRFESLHWW